jgi:formate dehydrogenase assembly factor FdhD
MRTYFRVKGGHLEEVKGEVVLDQPLTVHVNGERFVTLLCSPFTVIGYVRSDGLNLYAGDALDAADGP